MNTTDLLKRCRQAAYLEDTAVDYTDAVILGQMYDQMLQLYERAVVKSRQGYWFQSQKQSVTAGQSTYLLPPRAVMNGVERVQIAYDTSLDFVDLERVDENLSANYELGTGQTGQPARYVTRGRGIQLLPTPDSSVYTLRFFFSCRPNRLVAPQATTTSGMVSSVDNVAKTINVFSTTTSIDSSGTATAMTSGAWTLDILGGPGLSTSNADNVDAGWHDFILTSIVATISTLTWTFDPSADLSAVKPGDFIRASGQSEWPQISSDFHRTVADATAMKILTERRLTNPDLQALLESDLDRFLDLLQPRALNTPAQVVVAPISLYRGLRRAWPVKYP